MRIFATLFMLTLVPLSLAAEEAAPKALTWHHEGFASISKAANEAKAQGKRLLLGLSGSST